MPRKLIMVVLGAVVAGGVFAGGGAEPSVEEQVTIQVAYPVAVDAPIAEILEGYAQQYMAQNPNVQVETIYSGGYTDVRTTIQTTIDGGGDAPALAVMLATDLFDLANAQYIEPLTPLVTAMNDGDDYLADFLPAFLSNSYYLDEIWSLPFQRSAVVVYYNADLFAEAGVGVPTDWSSFAAAAAALTEGSGSDVTRWGLEWPSGWPYWTFQPLAIGAGQNIVGDSDTEVFFDDPDVVAAIEFYNSLSADSGAMPAGVQASWGNVVPNFVSGNTAMIVHTSGSLAGVLDQADFEVGVIGVPGRDGGYFSVPGGGNLYMIAGLSEAEKQAAFDFAVFLTDPARAADFSIRTGYIATRESAFTVPAMQTYFAQTPQAAQARAVLETAGKELAIQNLGAVRTIFHNYVQAAFNGEIEPAAAMAAAQSEADAALEDFR
ncbi:MAG: ABC transporter substrate-binding protein [Spirochaetales bacterium]|nr:ABC transporter substrate-binding protein [Spirochaetales bacterium]